MRWSYELGRTVAYGTSRLRVNFKIPISASAGTRTVIAR